MLLTRLLRAGAVATTALFACAALAQTGGAAKTPAPSGPGAGQGKASEARPIHPGDPAGLRSVEAGVGDVGPLSTSPREMRIDLRQAGFERVYAIPGQGGPGSGPTNFVRVDSGVAAVFPRSEYRNTPFGKVAEIPAGTTFYIGKLPDSVLQAGATPGGTSSLLRVERGVDLSARLTPMPTSTLVRTTSRVDMRAPAEAEAKREEIRREPPTLLSDPRLRERWIDSLGDREKKPAPVKMPGSK